MTLAVYAPASYAANVGTTVFAIPWSYQAANHVKPYLDGVALTTGFTVSAPIDGVVGGTVTFSTAPSGVSITFIRELPIDQPTDFRNQTTFDSKRHEDAYDREVMLSAQIDERLDRAVVARVGQAGQVLPTPANNYAIGWADGELINVQAIPTGNVSAAMLPVVQANTLPLARTAMGLGEIATLNNVNVTQVVDTIAQLKALDVPTSAVTYLVRGYYTAGDGGAKLVRWNGADTTADNGGSVHAPNAGGTGRWNQISEPFINVKQWGAKGDGVADDYAPLQQALSSATLTTPLYIPAGGKFKTSTTLTKSSAVAIFGDGDSSVILCDSDAITIVTGANSSARNFRLENITAPWTIERFQADGTRLATAPLVTQKNTGYQPTVNDSDVWAGLTAPQQLQNISPKLTFVRCDGATVDGVSGRFALIEIQNSSNCVVKNCRLFGGKGVWGTIFFKNDTATYGYGQENKAVFNIVDYGSFSGITFMGQMSPTAHSNVISRCGESGIKTVQGVSGSNDLRAYRAAITANTVTGAQFDGIDAASDFPATGLISAHHRILANNIYYSGSTGIWTDAKFCEISNNIVSRSLNRGIMLNLASQCSVVGNSLSDNNTQNNASMHHLTDGGARNYIAYNRVIGLASPSFLIYVNPSAGSTFVCNFLTGGTINIAAGNIYNFNTCADNNVFNQHTPVTVKRMYTEVSGFSEPPLTLGTYSLWIDASGRLRIKSSAPASDTDGIVVGTQA